MRPPITALFTPLSSEAWWHLKHKIEAIDPALRLETGECIITQPDGGQFRAERVSAVYEKANTIAAAHHYHVPPGRIAPPPWYSRNMQEWRPTGNSRAARTIRAASDAICNTLAEE